MVQRINLFEAHQTRLYVPVEVHLHVGGSKYCHYNTGVRRYWWVTAKIRESNKSTTYVPCLSSLCTWFRLTSFRTNYRKYSKRDNHSIILRTISRHVHHEYLQRHSRSTAVAHVTASSRLSNHTRRSPEPRTRLGTVPRYNQKEPKGTVRA